MAGGIDWFRWHHGSVTDPKFQLVAKRSGTRLPDVLAVWAYLLEQASAAIERGQFGEIDAEAVDCLFGFDDGVTKAILDTMQSRGLVDGGALTSWEKRQPKREREDNSAAERKRQQRAREADESNVTPCHATSHQKKPREEKRREDTSSLRSEEIGAPAPRKPRATRKCPDDFDVTDALRDWATENASGVDLARETDKFRDYTFKTAHTDWAGAWRNWMRRAAENARPPSRASPPQSKHAAAARAIYGAPSNPEFIDVETVVRQH